MLLWISCISICLSAEQQWEENPQMEQWVNDLNNENKNFAPGITSDDPPIGGTVDVNDNNVVIFLLALVGYFLYNKKIRKNKPET